MQRSHINEIETVPSGMVVGTDVELSYNGDHEGCDASLWRKSHTYEDVGYPSLLRRYLRTTPAGLNHRFRVTGLNRHRCILSRIQASAPKRSSPETSGPSDAALSTSGDPPKII